MATIHTNASAMTALQALNMTNRNLEATQAHISTGYRVASAEDNAVYWSIATTMRSDSLALSTVKDALGLGSATIDVAYTAINSSIDIVSKIKAKLVAARQPGVDRIKVQAEITQLQDQLRGIADSAVFSGENWLSVDSSDPGYNSSKSIVASFSRSNGVVSISTISVDISSTELFDAADQSGALDLEDTTTNGGIAYSVVTLDISTLTDSANDVADLEQMVGWVDGAIAKMTTAASDLGAVKQRVNLQKDFVTTLMDAITRGVGALVDADMNEESTRLQALQVQQQLGIQALGIANQNSQNILALFK